MSEKQNFPQEESQAGMDTFFAEPSAEQPVKVSGSSHSRNVKFLLAGVAVLVLLGIALTVFLLLERKGDGTDSSADPSLSETETNSILLNAGTLDTIQSVNVKNTTEFRLYVQEKETEGMVYAIQGYEDLPMDQNLLSTLARNGSELYADSLVEEDAQELDKYGLATPVAEVQMTYEDGSVFTMQVGNVSPMNSASTYCEVDGDVYLVKTSLVSNYSREDVDFLSRIILEEPPEEEYPIVESLRIERNDLDYDLYMEYMYDDSDDTSIGGTAATHKMLEPVPAYLSVDKSSSVTNGMFGLTAADIAAVKPDAAALKEAGISDPFCKVTMQCDDGNTYCLYLSDGFTEDGGTYYYAYLEGGSLLYTLTEEKAVWATVQPGDITAASIFATYVWNLKTLEVDAGTQQMHFTGSGEDADTYEVLKDGVVCDTERFRQFYRFFLSIYGESLYLGELPDAEADISVHVTTQDGKEDYTVSFYRLDAMKTAVAVNGIPTYSIRSSCLDTLVHNMEIFDNPDEAFTTTWQ